MIVWFLVCVTLSHRFTFEFPGKAAAVYGAQLACVGIPALRAWRRRGRRQLEGGQQRPHA